jgi:hypothetical protein
VVPHLQRGRHADAHAGVCRALRHGADHGMRQRFPHQPIAFRDAAHTSRHNCTFRVPLLRWRHSRHGLAGSVSRLGDARAAGHDHRRIVYHKYLSPTHMLALHFGPGNVNAWADPDLFTLHTIWPTDSHETIHLYSSVIGRMTSLFNEGLAVAFQVDPVRGDMTPRWNNRHVHQIAASLRTSGRLVPLARLLMIDEWRGIDSQVSYPQAGSFVRYLLDVHGGIAPLRQLFSGSTQTDAPALVRSKFEAAYGRPIEVLETEWHAFLDAWQ